MTKTYLDEEGLSQVWNVINARDEKIVSKIKTLEGKIESKSTSVPVGEAFGWTEGAAVTPIVGTASEYAEETTGEEGE